MRPLSESTAKTAPFAAALALQEEHARAYNELAEQIRPKSPEAASVLLTMRQRQEAQLRQLMCIYGISARKDPAIARPSDPRMAEGAKVTTEGLLGAPGRDPELERKLFVLQVVQPGLAGLMDGSVSTLAPVFAAAFATRNPATAFLVGIAASLGAGISMGFAEALSDDGVISGRGRPWIRGGVCGGMTTLGGIGHTLPFLLSNFWMATWIAVAVVAAELAAIAWIRNRYMDTPLLGAIFQVVLGGFLVFLVGILIGSL
jgi:erythrin-vacuolar iron transport family protein